MTDAAVRVCEFAAALKADLSRLPVTMPELALTLSGAEDGEWGLEGVFGGHEFWRAAPQLQDVFAQVADAVQDDVIDQIGRGWPELADDSGEFTGVLTPGSSASGAGWLDGAALYARFGELAGALGDRVRWQV